MERGDVVLVPFPFAELKAIKARPAVIISGETFMAAEGRIIVAGITSNIPAHQNPTAYVLPDWAKAGLRKPSVVTSWLATLSPRLIQLLVGKLTPEDPQEVEKRLKAAMVLDQLQFAEDLQDRRQGGLP